VNQTTATKQLRKKQSKRPGQAVAEGRHSQRIRKNAKRYQVIGKKAGGAGLEKKSQIITAYRAEENKGGNSKTRAKGRHQTERNENEIGL